MGCDSYLLNLRLRRSLPDDVYAPIDMASPMGIDIPWAGDSRRPAQLTASSHSLAADELCGPVERVG